MKKYLQFLYGGEPFSMTTPLPLARAVKRLAYNVGGVPYGTLESHKMMGSVEQDKVVISVVTPMNHSGNGFAATFIGRFVIDNGDVILSGVFRLRRFALLFLSVLLLFSVELLVRGILSHRFGMAFFGAIMTLFIGWMVSVSHKIAEKDIALIKQEITVILDSEA